MSNRKQEEEKERKIKIVKELLEENPNLSNKQIKKITGFGETTIRGYKKILQEQNEVDIESGEISLDKLNKVESEKEKNIRRMKELLDENPELTDQEIAKILKKARGTIWKYRQIIIERETGIEKEDRKNIKKIQELQKEKPDITREELADILQISVEKIDEYIRLIGENEELEDKKEKNIRKVKEILESDPDLTDQQIAERIRRSKDSVLIYKRILEERGEIKVVDVDEIAEFERLIKTQPELTNKQLAKMFGCSESKICKYKRILRERDSKLKTREDIKKERMQKIKELRAENEDISVQELADIFQCDITTIRKYIKELEEKGELNNKEEVKIEKLRKLMEEQPGLTNKQLADKLKWSKTTVIKYKRMLEKQSSMPKSESQKEKEEDTSSNSNEDTSSNGNEDTSSNSNEEQSVMSEEEQEMQIVKELLKEDSSLFIKQLAKMTGLPREKVSKYKKILEERGDFKSPKEQKIQRIKELLDENPKLSIEEIKRITGCSISTIGQAKRILREREENKSGSNKVRKVTENQAKKLCDSYTGEKTILTKLKLYISGCKERDIQQEELQTIKEVVILIDSYDAIVYYLNLCIKFRKIEEAIFFANGQIYNETFTREQQDKIRDFIATMKKMHKKQQAFKMLEIGAGVEVVAKDTGLSENTVKNLNRQLLARNNRRKPGEVATLR